VSVVVAPTQSDVYAALGAFLSGVLPAGVQVIRGLPNRAAMPPTSPGFVTMQALFEERLNMPVHSWNYDASTPPATLDVEQGVDLPVQIDCYGPTSGDWAATISTCFEDEYGFAALAPNCDPLYCNQAQMAPLTDEELEYEERWSLEAHLQYNPVATVQQQFADTLDFTSIDVNVEFPT
jgi:hypothetical protein